MPSINLISGCVMVSCADIYSSSPNPVLNHFGEELDGITRFILGTELFSFHSQVVTNISYIWRDHQISSSFIDFLFSCFNLFLLLSWAASYGSKFHELYTVWNFRCFGWFTFVSAEVSGYPPVSHFLGSNGWLQCVHVLQLDQLKVCLLWTERFVTQRWFKHKDIFLLSK